MTLAEFYTDTDQEGVEEVYNTDTIFTVDGSQSNNKLLAELEHLVIQFRTTVKKANYPLNYGCCRGNCCNMVYTNLFHSYD